MSKAKRGPCGRLGQTKPRGGLPGSKPLYRVFMGSADGGYYAEKSEWKSVTADEADKLTHKRACRVAGKLRRLGYTGSVPEPIKT